MWGIIGLVIIFGAYGIINIALGTFGVDPIQRFLNREVSNKRKKGYLPGRNSIAFCS